jgi:C4-dicarboxylate transporter, DctQ subunit
LIVSRHGRSPAVVVAGWLTQMSRALCVAAATLGLVLPVPVLYEVVMDQFKSPPTWVFETTSYTIILLAFAASGYGLSTGHHFRVALLPERFPALARPLARFSAVLQLAFGLILLVAGIEQVITDYVQGLQSDTLLAIPQYLPQMAFPIGGLVIALQGIAHLLVPPPERGHRAD